MRTCSGPPALVDAWFRPHSPVADLFAGPFGDVPGSCDPPARPEGDDRVRWWALGALLQAWERRGGVSPDDLRPATRIDVARAEHRLGMPLPPALVAYHRALGTSATAEEILPLVAPHGSASGDPVGPLLAAYPGIPDLPTRCSEARTGALW